MIKFRSRIENGNIIPEISLADYLETLYTNRDLALRPIVRSEFNQLDIITIEELLAARGKLSKHKAIGVDLLPDKLFHNNILWKTMETKILDTFNKWTRTLEIPQYVKIARIIPLSKDE